MESWSAAASFTTRLPSVVQNFEMVSTVATSLASVGVTAHTAPSSKSSRAKATPDFSEPHNGWLPTKRDSTDSTAATTLAFTLPTSVTIASAAKCGFIAAANSPIRPTGVQRITKSASATASATSSVASSTAPAVRHSAILSSRRTNPHTRSATPRCFAASPIEPPSKPTPMSVNFWNCTGVIMGGNGERFNFQMSLGN